MSLKRRRVVSSDEDYNDLNVPFDLDAKLMQTDLHMKSSVTPKYPACRKQTSIADIPDDPFLVILSYCSDSEDGLQRIKFAFRMWGYVSKIMREKVLSVAQATPVNLSKSFLISSKGCLDVEMACKLRIKLHSLCFKFVDQVYKSIFTHVLDSCEIEAISNISFPTHPTKCDLNLLKTSDEIGVPCDRNHRAILMSNMAFQEHIARIFEQKHCAPQRLEIRFKIEEKLHGPLLTNLSRNLEELKLEGWCSLPGQDTYLTARSLSCLEKVPGQFSKLKTVSFCWPRMRRDMLLKFESSSVETLSISGGLKIQHVNCPSLKTLRLVLNTGLIDFGIARQCRLTLQDLTLTISSVSANSSLYENITLLIESLSSLKKITLIAKCSQDFVIRSTSVEEIDLRRAENIVLDCICPNLKKNT